MMSYMFVDSLCIQYIAVIKSPCSEIYTIRISEMGPYRHKCLKKEDYIWIDLDTVSWPLSGYHSSSVAFEKMDDYLWYSYTAGHYLYVSNKMGESELVRLESEIIPKGAPHCFSFYYYLHGTEVPTLNFYLAKGKSFLIY